MLNIVKHRNIPFVISGIMLVLSVFALIKFGLKPGIDFTGGSLLEVKFAQRPEITQIQEVLTNLNIDNVTVQHSGIDGAIMRMRFVTEAEHQDILTKLREKFSNGSESAQSVMEVSFETIGAAVSANLRDRSLYTAVVIILATILYIAYSFRKVSRPVQSWKYGVAAIIAMIQNVLIIMGVFAVLGYYKGLDVGIPFVVAIMTIIGYSVNDTIVVFDRIRENLIRLGSDNFSETVNKAINETLARSINTSLTILLVMIALFIFGGESIRYFSLALVIGIAISIYSSIFLTSPFLVVMHNWSKK